MGPGEREGERGGGNGGRGGEGKEGVPELPNSELIGKPRTNRLDFE